MWWECSCVCIPFSYWCSAVWLPRVCVPVTHHASHADTQATLLLCAWRAWVAGSGACVGGRAGGCVGDNNTAVATCKALCPHPSPLQPPAHPHTRTHILHATLHTHMHTHTPAHPLVLHARAVALPSIVLCCEPTSSDLA